MLITVGARSSPLSRVQVQEVMNELHTHHPDIHFQPTFLETTGDIDLTTPLTDVTQGDFFTKEIDRLQLEGTIRLSIHSAKDLPDPIPHGLSVICITKGVDSRDSLVLPEGKTVETLPLNPRIGTCSMRRRDAVRKLRPDMVHVDIRGAIHQRLKFLEDGLVDALVVAEAALIRLNLTHLNRIFLHLDPAPFQGQLALIARSDDSQIRHLFKKMDTRRRILIFGPTLLQERLDTTWVHAPLLDIDELSITLSLQNHDGIIITSKTAARLLHKHLPNHTLPIFCIGTATGEVAKTYFPQNTLIVSDDAIQEGVVESILAAKFKPQKLLWLHSTESRTTLIDLLSASGITVDSIPAYTPKLKQNVEIDFAEIDEVLFTSPSTVHAFCKQSTTIPQSVTVSAIGPVTLKCLKETICSNPTLCQTSPMISEILNPQSKLKSCSSTMPNTMQPM